MKSRIPILEFLTGFTLLWFFPSAAFSQLTVTPLGASSPTNLVTALLGTGVSVSNVTYQGTGTSSGTFTGGTQPIGFSDGVILSTGDAANVVGSPAFNSSVTLGLAGDPSLQALNGGTPTHDATVLEFDFVPTNALITFQYVFASEEYNDFVGQGFNDTFGFFVNGTNAALIPGTAINVSINNVNSCNHKIYYVNNTAANASTICTTTPAPAGRLTSLNGLTKVFTVKAKVTPGVNNHIKLAIADTGDFAVDSDVFIEAGSFISVNPSDTPTPAPTRTPVITPTPECDPKIWPNPYSRRFAIFGTLKIDCIGPNDRVQIFTLTGEMVAKDIPPTAMIGTSGLAEWDGRNAKGVPVVPGVYYFVVLEGDKVRKTGKFLIQDAR